MKRDQLAPGIAYTKGDGDVRRILSVDGDRVCWFRPTPHVKGRHGLRYCTTAHWTKWLRGARRAPRWDRARDGGER